MNDKPDRLVVYMRAYLLLVDKIDEALTCLPDDCKASKTLESAIKDSFEVLYPPER